MKEKYDYFGKYTIIDGHTHIYGPMYQKNAEVERKARDGFPYDVILADELVAHMAKFDIHKFIAFPGHWNYSDEVYDPSYHIPNKHIAEAQEKYPDNIIGFGRVQPNYGVEAEKEAKRCFEELGLKGLKIQPEIDAMCMSNTERWKPIMKLLAKYDYPLLSHSYIHWATDSPGRFFKLAETFPEVNIIMSHGAFRHAYDAAIVAEHNDNIYLGISDMTISRILDVLKMGLEDRLLFSSDTPHYNPALTVMKVTTCPRINEEQKRKILGGNLAKILKLEI
jgi:predicted TIM-barrel fold metal-dependent hydrolase